MIARDKLFRTSITAYAVNRNGLIVAWNQAAERTFGYRESEALGQQCWELLSGRDMFGNQSCCEGCPVRATAFSNELINPFQVDFMTAALERRRFTVNTLMLLDGPGKEVFVHLCDDESDLNESLASEHVTSNATASKRYKPLTPRQTEVFRLLHKGLTVAEIATELGISASTIRNHTQHILLKLDVHSRFEAVALGRKLGFI